MKGYFDSAATTMVDEDVAKCVYEAMLQYGGNPSSGHALGFEAAKKLQEARKKVAELLGAGEKEVFFTSGGTEANNLLLQGAARARRKQAPKILCSEVEHASVTETLAAMGQEGSVLMPVASDRTAELKAEDFLAMADEKTGLASLMLVNNETGAVNPVSALAEELHARNKYTLVHADMVAALGKEPIRLSSMGVDMASFSGHKIHGPKGIGLAYIKSGIHLRPMIYGGEQQERVLPGTENLPAVLGFVFALEKALKEAEQNRAQAEKCKKVLLETLQQSLPNAVFHLPATASPFLLHLSTCSVKSETMLNALSSLGFCISAGSACAKGAQSHVLTAMGLPKVESDTALRISFCGRETEEETLALAKTIIEAEGKLVHAYRTK